MSKEYNEIDDQYKEELHGQEFEFDTESLWEKMADKLDEDKKRPIFLWLLLTGILLLTVGGGIYYFFTTNDLNLVYSTDLQEVPAKDAGQKSNKSAEEKIINSQKTPSSAITETENNLAKVHEDEGFKSLNSKKGEENSRIQTAIAKNLRESKQTESQSPTQGNPSQNSLSIINSTSVIKRRPKAEALIFDPIHLQKEEINAKSEKSNINQKEKSILSSISEDTIKSQLAIKLHNNQISVVPFIPSILSTLLPRERGIKIPGPKAIQQTSRKFAIEWQNTVLLPYFGEIEPNVTPLISLSSQLRGQFYLNQNISLIAGIEYLLVNEKFYWQKNISTKEKKYRDDAYFLLTNQTTEFVGDSIFEVSTTQKTRQRLNKHVFTNIPIGIQYARDVHHWRFGMSVSGIFNLSHSFEGYVIDDNELNTSIAEGSHPRYKKKIGLGLSLAPFAGYKLSNSWTIKVGVPMRFSSSSWFNDSISGTAKWKTIGLSLGLNYRI